MISEENKSSGAPAKAGALAGKALMLPALLPSKEHKA